ncbi:hypothetical protein D8I24_3884 (plasmid) [Cupriavidus necator H850]|nr:hypothetical protein D8I24_3884 [Cupriavidus necator H850]
MQVLAGLVERIEVFAQLTDFLHDLERKPLSEAAAASICRLSR